MEPDIRDFLVRIANTLGMFFIWMIVNVTVGIKWGYAFWGNHFTKGNLIFFIWFIISIILLVWYLKRLWSKPLNIKM